MITPTQVKNNIGKLVFLNSIDPVHKIGKIVDIGFYFDVRVDFGDVILGCPTGHLTLLSDITNRFMKIELESLVEEQYGSKYLERASPREAVFGCIERYTSEW